MLDTIVFNCYAVKNWTAIERLHAPIADSRQYGYAVNYIRYECLPLPQKTLSTYIFNVCTLHSCYFGM